MEINFTLILKFMEYQDFYNLCGLGMGTRSQNGSGSLLLSAARGRQKVFTLGIG